MNNHILFAGLLLVFYLYLLARPQHIKRCCCFTIGAGGLAAVILIGFFNIWASHTWARVLIGVFGTLGTLTAFIGACFACCSEEVQAKTQETTGQKQ